MKKSILLASLLVAVVLAACPSKGKAATPSAPKPVAPAPVAKPVTVTAPPPAPVKAAPAPAAVAPVATARVVQVAPTAARIQYPQAMQDADLVMKRAQGALLNKPAANNQLVQVPAPQVYQKHMDDKKVLRHPFVYRGVRYSPLYRLSHLFLVYYVMRSSDEDEQHEIDCRLPSNEVEILVCKEAKRQLDLQGY